MTTAEYAYNKQNVMVWKLYSSLVIFKALILGVNRPLINLRIAYLYNIHILSWIGKSIKKNYFVLT